LDTSDDCLRQTSIVYSLRVIVWRKKLGHVVGDKAGGDGAGGEGGLTETASDKANVAAQATNSRSLKSGVNVIKI
jgi:hypothetical protein